MLPREKFQQRGIDSLSDFDLVSILIGSGIKGRCFTKISKSVIVKFRKILKTSNDITLQDLTDIEGIGNVVGMRILAGIELGRRLYFRNNGTCTLIHNSQQAFELLKDMGNLKKERVDALYINSRFELLKRETVVIGSLNCAGLLPRDVIYPALLCNASYIVLAHNHPSGNCLPSNEDITLTERLLEAFELMGLNLLDHLVISESSWTCVDLKGKTNQNREKVV